MSGYISFYGGKMEGVVMKDADDKLYKFYKQLTNKETEISSSKRLEWVKKKKMPITMNLKK